MSLTSVDYRISRAEICMTDPAPFAQHFEARIAIPIADVSDMGIALNNAYSMIKPGDLINVCAYESRAWEAVTEVATFRVVATDKERLRLFQIGQTVKIPPAARVLPKPELTPLKVVKVGRSFEVRDGKGNIIEAFVDEKQAEAFKDREMSLGKRGAA